MKMPLAKILILAVILISADVYGCTVRGLLISSDMSDRGKVSTETNLSGTCRNEFGCRVTYEIGVNYYSNQEMNGFPVNTPAYQAFDVVETVDEGRYEIRDRESFRVLGPCTGLNVKNCSKVQIKADDFECD